MKYRGRIEIINSDKIYYGLRPNKSRVDLNNSSVRLNDEDHSHRTGDRTETQEGTAT